MGILYLGNLDLTGENSIHLATFIDAIVPLILIWYGFKFYTRPPAMESKKGFTSIYTMANHEAWDYAQKLGGKLYMGIGVIALLIFIIKLQIFGEREPIVLTIIYTIGIFVMIFLSHVFIQKKCREKYGHIIEEEEAKPVVGIWNLDVTPAAKTEEHDEEFMKNFENKEENEAPKKKRKKKSKDKDKEQ